MAKTRLQNEDPEVTTTPGTYDIIILVDNQERPDGEEVKYDLQQYCSDRGKHVTFTIMDTTEISSSDRGTSSLQSAVEEGKIVVPIFTEKFFSNRNCLNILYTTIIKSMKEKGNANFFKPVFFDNPKKARFTPVQFCNFRSFWWERDRDKEILVKILCL